MSLPLGITWPDGPDARYGTAYRCRIATGFRLVRAPGRARRVPAMQPRRPGVPLPAAGQVTSLELFFDLVFVFTITQLTATVAPGGWAVPGRSALLLLIL